ncbi:stu1 [Gossypium arboreum]|nr:stu1 [Gossypium arboreum]
MDQCGYLYYQYNEMASPYDRVPLHVKMNELGKHYPGLFDLRSTEISPYSWMAIAWYPVYQIPMATNVKELSACFLTYHPLSGSRTGSNKEEISLPPFAVVTYKLFGTLWINPETSDKDTIICQQTAASNWLRQLQFQHHDFNFFMSRQFQNP